MTIVKLNKVVEDLQGIKSVGVYFDTEKNEVLVDFFGTSQRYAVGSSVVDGEQLNFNAFNAEKYCKGQGFTLGRYTQEQLERGYLSGLFLLGNVSKDSHFRNAHQEFNFAQFGPFEFYNDRIDSWSKSGYGTKIIAVSSMGEETGETCKINCLQVNLQDLHETRYTLELPVIKLNAPDWHAIDGR